jgi:hypothetical protein
LSFASSAATLSSVFGIGPNSFEYSQRRLKEPLPSNTGTRNPDYLTQGWEDQF